MKIIFVFLLLALAIIGANANLQAASTTQKTKAPSPKAQANFFLGNGTQTVQKLALLFPQKKNKAALVYASLATLFAVGSAAVYVAAGSNVNLWTLALLLGVVAVGFMVLWLIRFMTGGRPLF